METPLVRADLCVDVRAAHCGEVVVMIMVLLRELISRRVVEQCLDVHMPQVMEESVFLGDTTDLVRSRSRVEECIFFLKWWFRPLGASEVPLAWPCT